MSTAAAKTTDHSDTLAVVGGMMADVVMHEATIFKLIKDKSGDGVKIEGNANYWYRTVRVTGTYTGRGRDEAGTRPDYASPTTKPAKYGLNLLWIPMEVSSRAKKAGALIGPPSVTIEHASFQNLLADWALLSNQSVLGQHEGWLSVATNADTGVTVNLTDMQQVKKGMIVDSYDSSGSKEIDAKEITAVNLDTKQITIGSSTWTVGSRIIRSGSRDTYMHGFGDLINPNSDIIVDGYPVRYKDEVYANLNRTTYADWSSILMWAGTEGAAVAPKPRMLQSLFARFVSRTGNALCPFTDAMASPATCEALSDVIDQSFRQIKKKSRLDIGEDDNLTYRSVSLKKKKVVINSIPGWRHHVIDFVDFDKPNDDGVKLRWCDKPGFLPDQDGIWRRQDNNAGGKAVYAASFQVDWEMVGHPRHCATLAGIALSDSLRNAPD